MLVRRRVKGTAIGTEATTVGRSRRILVLATLVLGAGLVPVGGGAATAGPAAPAAPTGFTSSPEQGLTGTAIQVRGRDCRLPGTDEPGEGVVVRLAGAGAVSAYATVPVARDGSWSGTLEVPAGTPARTLRLEARCASPGYEDRDPVTYATRSFTVTGEGPGAESTPATPRFNGGIEPFGEYDGQSTCSPSVKPGMAAFMRLVQRHYGGGSLGVGGPAAPAAPASTRRAGPGTGP